MITVKMDEDTALDMLMDRLEYWIKDHSEASKYIDRKLYEQMYSEYLENGVFSSMEFDPMNIVDNDYINYCQIVEPDDDENYKKLDEFYQKNGIGDISGEDIEGSYIEAACNYEGQNYYLIRW